MKLNPKIEAALFTIGALCLIALFVAIAMLTPDTIYIIALLAAAIGSVKFIFDLALDYIESRNKIKKLQEDIDADKMEKNNVRI
jgi:hypothetical protein